MDRRVAWAIYEMERRMSEPLRVVDLAVGVNLSVSRFTLIFRATIGQSPAQYLRRLRLERARVLLETTFLSIKEVRASVGISDASHFTRDFAQAYGQSPRMWRQRVPRPPPAADSARVC
jgi:AraC family transcriptional regulator, carnitine catabolism transcriptional activator